MNLRQLLGSFGLCNMLLGCLLSSGVGSACTRFVPQDGESTGEQTSEGSAGTQASGSFSDGTQSTGEKGVGDLTSPDTSAAGGIPSGNTLTSSASGGESAGNSSSGGESTEEPGPVETSSEPETPDCKDGDEKSCNEDEAGQEIQFPGGVAQGSCRAGKKTCTGGSWSACVGAIAPKPKDTCELGNDDNCNGRPTDHCNCAVGETQECGSDVGECRKGKLTCTAQGTWGETCEGEVKPKKEICDGRADENCDGKPDIENCECINGRTEPCGVHTVGACRQGTRTCSDGTWGRCIGEILPVPERCDGRGIDEDCDGRADKADSDCDCIIGERRGCRLAGRLGDCALGESQCFNGRWGACRARFRPSTEVCGIPKGSNNASLDPRTGDEDCDGKVDESDVTNGFMPSDPNSEGQLYMLDRDGDGWGAIGKKKSDVLRRYCNSRVHEVPEGFVRAVTGRAETDCGDCPGSGAIVNPGYSGKYMNMPNRCLEEVNWRNGAYDYNCLRGEEKKYLMTGNCDIEELGESCEIPGEGIWDGGGKPPACGETSMWINPSDCIADIVDGKKACVPKDMTAPLNEQLCR